MHKIPLGGLRKFKAPNFFATDLKEKNAILKINVDIFLSTKLKISLAGNYAWPRRS